MYTIMGCGRREERGWGGGWSTMWGLLIEGTSFRVHMTWGNVYLLLPVLCSVHVCLCMETCMLALPWDFTAKKKHDLLYLVDIIIWQGPRLERNQLKYYTAVGLIFSISTFILSLFPGSKHWHCTTCTARAPLAWQTKPQISHLCICI